MRLSYFLTMFEIDFPLYDFSIQQHERGKSIFDIVRKKYVQATPEEIVRQYLIHYLCKEKGYPKSLMAVEMSLKLNNTLRRCDIVIYKESEPILIVECKAPSVKLNQKVFEQIARYNLVLKVPYLLVSNGNLSYFCTVDIENKRYDFLDFIPDYSEL